MVVLDERENKTTNNLDKNLGIVDLNSESILVYKQYVSHVVILFKIVYNK